MSKSSRYLSTGFLATSLALSAGSAAAAPKHHKSHKPHAAEQAPGDFPTWLKKTRAEAKKKKISKKVINDALPLTLTPDAEVLERNAHQPHTTMTLQQYMEKTDSPEMVSKGREAFNANADALQKAGNAHNVDPAILASLWGNESRYGQNTGSFEVVRSIATLAHGSPKSTRRAYFKSELFEALKILDKQHMPASDLKGSWAGALGQPQFMPSNVNAYARDGDGDGKIDIWKSSADVFASSANFLQHLGWKKGEAWGRPVQLPAGFDGGQAGLDQRHPVSFWSQQGVKLMDGGAIPAGDTKGEASVIQPDDKGTQAYIVYDNFRTLLKWNGAVPFAVSVGMLSDQIASRATAAQEGTISTTGSAPPPTPAANPATAAKPAAAPAATPSARSAATPAATPPAATAAPGTASGGRVPNPDFSRIRPVLRP